LKLDVHDKVRCQSWPAEGGDLESGIQTSTQE